MILEILFYTSSGINIQSNGSNYIAGHEPFHKQYIRSKVFQITNNLSYNVGKHALLWCFFEKYQFENSFNLGGYDFNPYRGTFNIPGFGGPYTSVQDF
jgi:hypothetical protein